MRRRRALRAVWLALALAGRWGCDIAVAAEPPLEQAKGELDQLRARIETLRGERHSTEERRAALLEELRQAEGEIDRISQEAYQRAQDLQLEQQILGELAPKVERQRKAVEREREMLAQQIRAAYAMGRVERLKLLLSQKEPAMVSRMLVYYDYLNLARGERIAGLKLELERLERLEKEANGEESRVTGLSEALERERAGLEHARRARGELLAALEQEILSKDQMLQELDGDRLRLQTLVTKLDDESKKAEEKRAEEARRTVEEARRAEQRKQEEERRRQEAERLAEERKTKAEAEARQEEERKRLEQERLAAERLRLEEEAKRASLAAGDSKWSGGVSIATPAPFLDGGVSERSAPETEASGSIARPPPEKEAAKEESVEQIRERLSRRAPPPQVTETFPKRKGRMPWPVDGKVVAEYGAPRAGGQSWDGVVLEAAEGSEVRGVHPGKVVFADWLKGYGQLLIIDHGDGYLTLYGNNQALLKKRGDEVAAGETVALAGGKGEAGGAQGGVYFGVRHRAAAANPSQWCGRED